MSLRILDGNTEVWAKRHRISLKPRACPKCGIDLFPTIPFATKDYRGLRSEPHACGSQYDLKRIVPISPAERAEMQSLYCELASLSPDQETPK
jgi:hypothetical protein